MTVIDTTDLYWDCECGTDNYFNHVSTPECVHCGAHQDDMPDSIVEELVAFACATLLRHYKRAYPHHEQLGESPIYVDDLAEMLRERGCKV